MMYGEKSQAPYSRERRDVDVHVNVHPHVEDPRYDLCARAKAGWLCTRKPGHDGPCAAIELDTPIAGPKMHWNADGLHIEDPRLADRPETVGGVKGCWTITWAEIDQRRAEVKELAKKLKTK